MPRTSADRAARDTEIRASGLAGRLLADRYGLTPTQIGRIRSTVARPPTKRERFDLSLAGEGWVAACMEPDEWAEWLRANPRLNDAQFADRPCQDCPLGFAAEMRAIGRCNGSPGAVGGRHEPDDDEEGEGPAMLNQARPPAVERLPDGPPAEPTPPRQRRSTLPNVLSTRQEEVLGVLVETGSRAATAKRLGLVYQSVDAMLEAIAKKGLLPVGVPDLPRRLRAKGDVGVRVVVPAKPLIPCGGCSHAVVCSIRPILEHDFPTNIVGPHPAIHLEVRCDHFLAATS